ncbi:MAG TPA: BON domain-containing protein [Acidobacteriaceae bacterium]|jgi:osmotically-inducible protein OsmY
MNSGLPLTLAAILSATTSFAQSQSEVAVRKALVSRSFRNVHSSVQGGVAVLTGTVELYGAKIRADQQVSRVPGIRAIRDDIRVAAPAVSDHHLQMEIQNTIAYNSFESLDHLPVATQRISVQVHHGVVTLDGREASPQLAAIAVYTVANTVGVTDLIDNIQRKPGSLPIANWPDGATGVSTLP